MVDPSVEIKETKRKRDIEIKKSPPSKKHLRWKIGGAPIGKRVLEYSMP